MKKITLIIGLFVCFIGAAAAQSFDPAEKLITKLGDAGITLTQDQVEAVNTLADETLKADYPQGGEVRSDAAFSEAVSEFKQNVFKNIMTADQRRAFNATR